MPDGKKELDELDAKATGGFGGTSLADARLMRMRLVKLVARDGTTLVTWARTLPYRNNGHPGSMSWGARFFVMHALETHHGTEYPVYKEVFVACAMVADPDGPDAEKP